MATPITKVELFFACLGEGWTESYWILTPTIATPTSHLATVDEMQPVAESMALVRDAINATQTFINYLRVTNFPDFPQLISRGGISQAYPHSAALGVQGGTDNPKSAVLVKFRNASGSRKSQKYFRGYADDYVVNGGVITPGSSAIALQTQARILSFGNYLAANGFGWLGVGLNQQSKITALATPNTGLNVVTVSPIASPPAPAPWAPAEGSTVPVRLSGMIGSGTLRRTLNYVVSGAGLTLTSAKPFAALPYVSGGRAVYAPPAFYPYATGKTVPFRCVERKTGRVAFQSAGRRAAVRQG